MALAKSIQSMRTQNRNTASDRLLKQVSSTQTRTIPSAQTRIPTTQTRTIPSTQTRTIPSTQTGAIGTTQTRTVDIDSNIPNNQGLSYATLLALARQYGLNPNNLIGSNLEQVRGNTTNQIIDSQNEARQILDMRNRNMQNQLPMTRFPDSSGGLFFQQNPNNFGNQPMTRFSDFNQNQMNPFNKFSNFNQMNQMNQMQQPMQQPMQGFQQQPMQGFQQQPMQQPMQNYQSQPMRNYQTGYPLQLPQQPQSMYPPLGGFALQNQNQNNSGLDTAIANMNNNNFYN